MTWNQRLYLFIPWKVKERSHCLLIFIQLITMRWHRRLDNLVVRLVWDLSTLERILCSDLIQFWTGCCLFKVLTPIDEYWVPHWGRQCLRLVSIELESSLLSMKILLNLMSFVRLVVRLEQVSRRELAWFQDNSASIHVLSSTPRFFLIRCNPWVTMISFDDSWSWINLLLALTQLKLWRIVA